MPKIERKKKGLQRARTGSSGGRSGSEPSRSAPTRQFLADAAVAATGSNVLTNASLSLDLADDTATAATLKEPPPSSASTVSATQDATNQELMKELIDDDVDDIVVDKLWARHVSVAFLFVHVHGAPELSQWKGHRGVESKIKKALGIHKNHKITKLLELIKDRHNRGIPYIGE